MEPAFERARVWRDPAAMSTIPSFLKDEKKRKKNPPYFCWVKHVLKEAASRAKEMLTRGTRSWSARRCSSGVRFRFVQNCSDPRSKHLPSQRWQSDGICVEPGFYKKERINGKKKKGKGAAYVPLLILTILPTSFFAPKLTAPAFKVLPRPLMAGTK